MPQNRRMRLASFIIDNIELILTDWVAFAKTRLPAATGMTELALRNDAHSILTEIAQDMRRMQDEDQQIAKSQGLTDIDNSHISTPAKSHALQRKRSGYEVNQMVSEFRALRSTVLRLWAASNHDGSKHDLADITRFNEAIDEVLTESLKFFVAEVDRARNLFLGVLGHDLRSPLSTIVSTAEYQLKIRPDDRQSTLILRGAMHIKVLLDDLLSYTRDRLGVGLSIRPAQMRLDQLAKETRDELLAIHSARAVDLKIEGDLCGVWDKARLHQVLSNLLSNAMKYGAASMPVRLGLEGTDKDLVILSVHNFGTTIPADLLPDLFEPLVRGSSIGSNSQQTGENMGLGLFIAREVVAAHGGSIHVTSTDQDGTRFEIKLPRFATAQATQQEGVIQGRSHI
jgi:signal transduction histidine kinase